MCQAMLRSLATLRISPFLPSSSPMRPPLRGAASLVRRVRENKRPARNRARPRDAGCIKARADDGKQAEQARRRGRRLNSALLWDLGLHDRVGQRAVQLALVEDIADVVDEAVG